MSTYDIDGKKLPSVTTIISDCSDKSPALTQWAANMVIAWIKQNTYYRPVSDSDIRDYCYLCNEGALESARFHFREVSQEALNIGSEVHKAIEVWLKHGMEPIKPKEQALNGFNAFLKWAKEHKLEPIGLELTVFDHRAAGTLDFAGYVDNEITIIDFKSSKAIYPEYRYQVAKYRHMYNQDLMKFAATKNGILRLDKETGLPEYKDTTKTYKKDLAVFEKMADLYFQRHPRIAKGAGIDIKV